MFCNGTNANYNDETIGTPLEISVAEAFADRGAKCVIGFSGGLSFSDTSVFLPTSHVTTHS